MLIFILASISCVTASDINTTIDDTVLIDTSDDSVEGIQTVSLSKNDKEGLISSKYESSALYSKSESDVLKSTLYSNNSNSCDNIQNSLNTESNVVYLNNTSYSADKLLNITSKNISVTGSNNNNGFSSFEGSNTPNGTVLDITGHSNVTLSNIIFQNFKNTAIKIDNSNVNFVNCSFVGNNITDGDGGAIYVNAGTVTFNNCNFTNNRAISSNIANNGFDFFNDDGTGPGGVNCQGGAVSINNTNSSFQNCNFINNKATDGGAVYIINGLSNFTNCHFSSNIAETIYRSIGGNIGMGVGGAVYINTGNGRFNNCNFDANRANGTGGAVCIDTTIDEGKCSGIFTNCNFNNNQAENGGAISIYEGSSSVTNSNFNNNKADYGAGVYMSMTPVNFSNCKFNNNKASNSVGGGVYVAYGQGNFNSCLFSNNNAVKGGGAYLFSTKIDFVNSNFTKNSASEQGGAICTLQANSTLNSCDFADNTADSGNAIYTNARLYLNNINNINIDDIVLGNGAYINTNLKISASNHTYGESVPLTIDLSVNNTKPSTQVEVFVNNTRYDLNLVNGRGVINLDNLNPGVYVANVSYNGIFNSVTFSVNKRNISDNINLTYKGSIKDFNVNVDFPEGTTGKLILTIDEVNYTENIVNNNVKFNIKGEFKNTQDIVITYSGNDEEFTKEYTLNLNTSSVNLDIEVYNGIYGENIPITINLSKDTIPLTTTVNVTVNNAKYLVNVTDGVGTLNLTDLNLGTYNVTVKYEDAYETVTFSVKRNITINDVNIIVENNDNDSSIVINFPQNATGNVTITVDNKDYTAGIVNRNATFNINRTFTEKENLSIVYSGDDLNTGFNGTVSIFFDNFKLIADNVTKYYHNATQFYASLISNGAPLVGQNVTITINGKKYSRTTNEKGTVNLTINSNPGIYNVITSYTDHDTGETINITSTVTVLSTVSGENIVKYYRNATRYYATFLDNKGNPLTNTVVRFNIHGVFYNATTNNEGVASLGINLLPKDYIITAYNPVNDQAFSNNITVLSTLDTSNVVKYFRNGTQFTAKVLNGVGDVVAGSVVTFNIHGKLYDRITDNNGVATLSINLDPGDYTITVYNNITGQSVGNNVKVLSVLTGADLTKNYNQNASYIVHFVDNQGNAVTGKTITFNINGKFYTRSTDSNGDARLAINLIPGRYIITASTEVDGGNAITSNIINVL